ncbi:MAG: hypothetical protein HY014_03360 [Acidobacteria bacterium]|nr:hypothetical protein [Acidobacteriota bacterium]MBI3487190.1 hypothetical protein [Acidobacteriota bacterium]
MKRSTLANWRVKGDGPPFFKFGRRIVLYRKGLLEKWEAEHLFLATKVKAPGERIPSQK